MAFDKTLPSNSTKIRNYPSVLTGNFAAIEEGGSTLQVWKQNYIQRDAIPSAPALIPARIDNVMQVYSKQNTLDSKTDLFVTDDRAIENTMQLTESGKVGGQAQSFVMKDVSFGTKASIYTQDNLVTAWATVNSAGTLVTGSGLTSVRDSLGLYTLTFSTAVIVNYGVQVTPIRNLTGSNLAYVGSYHTVTLPSFKVTTGVFKSTTQYDLVDAAFTVMVLGGR